VDRKPEEQHKPYQLEGGIGVFEFVQIILKRKKLIIGVFLIAIIVAIAASYMIKPVYRVSAVVGPGQIYVLEAVQNSLIWREADIDTPENIEALISQNPFHYETLTQLGWDLQDPKNKFDVKTKLQQRTKYISISIDSAEPERAKKYLNTLLVKTHAFYYPRVETNIELLNNTKQRIINERQSVSGQIKILESKLNMLDLENVKLQKQIDEIQSKSEQALDQRRKVLAQESNPDNMTPLLIYSNIMQENLSQLDKLLNSMKENNKLQREDLQQDIKDLKVQLANLDVRLADVESKLANLGVKTESLNVQSSESEAQQNDLKSQQIEVSGIKIVQEPIVDPQRVSPKRTLMVAVAGVLGLFVGVFAAFAAEFWQSHKTAA